MEKLFVIKNDGRQELFQGNKIITSITNAATDIGLNLNVSDTNIIMKEFYKQANIVSKNNRTISVLEIKILIYKILKTLYFNNVAEKYIKI